MRCETAQSAGFWQRHSGTAGKLPSRRLHRRFSAAPNPLSSAACGLRRTVFSVISLIRWAILASLLPAALSAQASDPFAWLQPTVTIDAAARSRLDRGEVIVRVLPTVDGEI